MLFIFASWSVAADDGHRGQGYAFFAPSAVISEGVYAGTASFGGGGEFILYKGIGAGADLAYISPWGDFSDGIGMFSLNASCHFNRAGKVSPFVTAGYSLAFRSGHADLFNFGGGAHWWFGEGVGLRLEFRDHVQAGYNTHLMQARIGFSFR